MLETWWGDAFIELVVSVVNVARRWMIKTGNTIQQAGFAGAVGTDNGGDQSRLNLDIDAGQRFQTAE